MKMKNAHLVLKGYDLACSTKDLLHFYPELKNYDKLQNLSKLADQWIADFIQDAKSKEVN
jgi:hypothetical protein